MDKDIIDARTTGRHAIDVIASYNPYTQFSVRENILYLRVAGTLLPEQEEIAKFYKEEIKLYLTVPPEKGGMCIRGHQITWQVSEYGTWLCSCASQHKEPGAMSQASDKL